MSCNHTRLLITIVLISSYLMLESEGKTYSKTVPIMNFRRDSGWLFIDRININPGGLDI
jgi:hypothetical protein